MATISRFRAVALIGKLRLTGFLAWLMWLGVHLVYLTGFKNQLSALVHWSVSFLGRGRSERTTTEQQIFARAALQSAPGRRLRPGQQSRRLRGDPVDCSTPSHRAELEARAAEEARLTDAGERGKQKVS